MAELARYKRPETEMLPGVGRPVVSKPVTLDTGAEYGPPVAPFVSGGMRSPSVISESATSTPSQAIGMPRRQVVPTQVGSDGGMISVNLTPEDRQLKGNLQQIDGMLASGVQPTAEQAQRIQGIRRQAGFLRGGTDRVPVGPDGLPLRQSGGTPTWADMQRQWQGRQGDGMQGMRAAQNASRILAGGGGGGAAGIPAQITPSGPSRTWSEAKSNDRGVIANAAARRDYNNSIKFGIAADKNQIDRETIATQAGTARLGFRNQQEIAAAGDAIQTERNKLLSEELGMRKVGVEAQAELDLANAKVAGVPKITPHFGEIESVTKDGITQTPYVVVPDGKGGFRQVTPTQGGTATPAVSLSAAQKAKAVAYAKANPKEDRASILAKIMAGDI